MCYHIRIILLYIQLNLNIYFFNNIIIPIARCVIKYNTFILTHKNLDELCGHFTVGRIEKRKRHISL